MSTATCARCGEAEVTVERHHPTGRHDGAYLDPKFMISLCTRCHAGGHAWLESRGLGGGGNRQAGLTVLETVELCLRRLGVGCEHLATGSEPAPIFALLFRVLVRWADQLRQTIDALYQGFSQWRVDPAFYLQERTKRS